MVILGGRAQLGICVIRCWDWAESGWIVQDPQFLLFLSQVADFVVLPKPRCLFFFFFFLFVVDFVIH